MGAASAAPTSLMFWKRKKTTVTTQEERVEEIRLSYEELRNKTIMLREKIHKECQEAIEAMQTDEEKDLSQYFNKHYWFFIKRDLGIPRIWGVGKYTHSGNLVLFSTGDVASLKEFSPDRMLYHPACVRNMTHCVHPNMQMYNPNRTYAEWPDGSNRLLLTAEANHMQALGIKADENNMLEKMYDRSGFCWELMWRLQNRQLSTPESPFLPYPEKRYCS